MGTRTRAGYRAATMGDAGVKERRVSGARGLVPLQRCPRCGLVLAPRASWLAITYCPRCLARSRIIVELSNAGKAQRAPTSGDTPPERRRTSRIRT
jgi:uncharacterized OB-fold protein